MGAADEIRPDVGEQMHHEVWHPMVIKWCLYVRHKSAKVYDAMRDMGSIGLPNNRTLFDSRQQETATETLLHTKDPDTEKEAETWHDAEMHTTRL